MKLVRSFTIKGAFHVPRGGKKPTKCFPGLNDLLEYARTNPYKYNNYKKKFESIVINRSRVQLRGFKPKGRVRLHYFFFEPLDGHYRDYGNISAGAEKIILDALQIAKIIENDSPKFVGPSRYTYIYTKDEPAITVEIEEIGDLVEIKDLEREE